MTYHNLSWFIHTSGNCLFHHGDEQKPLIPLPTYFGSIASDVWLMTDREASAFQTQFQNKNHHESPNIQQSSNKHPASACAFISASGPASGELRLVSLPWLFLWSSRLMPVLVSRVWAHIRSQWFSTPQFDQFEGAKPMTDISSFHQCNWCTWGQLPS